VHYHYNTIVLEVGGAMAYESHPEINEGWVRYCEEMYEYSGKTTQIQEHTFPWYKNSIHAENGGGRFLAKEQVRELVAYCKERMLDVIPEVPSLSHCDYLLINHPELGERKDDPYPDTYCPSDERAYELLFDVLDEVIDVFRPDTVHIGHDEYYSIGLCDRCKGKPAEQLYADDIRRIYGHLAQYGIQTMMWSEKLIAAADRNGQGFGGSAVPMYNEDTGAYMGTIPATHPAIDRIPRDIVMLHWYWSINREYEDEFLRRGMRVIFGNFHGHTFVDWGGRLAGGVQGGIISNWSALTEANMQRNGVLFSMAYSAYLFWHDSCEEDQYETIAELAFANLFAYRYGGLLEAAERKAPGTGSAYVDIVHTTDYFTAYRVFFDGIFLDNDEYRIGEYVLEYADGTEAAVPIVYGMNISNKDRSWSRHIDERSLLTTAGYRCDSSLLETAYTTLPVRYGAETYYRWIARNPHPGKTIERVRLQATAPGGCAIMVKQMRIH
ncbi:MAG: family 20 glycosylhydrolase, partial [Paenibacillaceae bacterium]|nr:family 20 glycosylhydrolase [Paenibacillaceae bacterium]